MTARAFRTAASPARVGIQDHVGGTVMSLLFARAAVVPFWMIAVALIAVLGPPGGPGVRDLLLLLGLTLVASALLALVASAFRARLPHAHSSRVRPRDGYRRRTG